MVPEPVAEAITRRSLFGYTCAAVSPKAASA